MKNYVSISLFIFWAVVVAVMTAGLVFSDQNKTPTQITGDQIATSPSNSSANSNQKTTLTMTEVAKHNQATDCWQVINNEVYNFTSFLNKHPAGADAMIPYCGQDSTIAYNTQGGRGQDHSAQARSLLASYLIGPLGQTVTTRELAPIPAPTNNNQTVRENKREQEDD